MGAYWRYLKSEFIFLFGLIWAAVGTPFVGVAVWIMMTESQIAQRGIAAQATLVEKIHGKGDKGSSVYKLKYVFDDAAGKEHIREAKVKWEVWRGFEDGARLPIVYLPERPGQSRLGGSLKESEWILAAIFGGLGLVFGGIGWFLVIKAFRRARRSIGLMSNGISVIGVVKDVLEDLQVNVNGRHPLYLSFKFKGIDGRDYEGQSRYLPRARESLWKAGDNVTVLCDPRDPAHFEADVLGARPESTPPTAWGSAS